MNSPAYQTSYSTIDYPATRISSETSAAGIHTSGHANELWAEGDLVQLVNAAFKSYHSVLALARSPLANSTLVRPLLVLDDVSPTADERGQALRLVLRWAVEQLAPELPTYPLDEYRPLDDPAWRDPHWWRYNILRHRYLEPLHPDEFVEGGRYTETLLALTGIPSVDTLFDERNRAIREVAQWLRQQMQGGQADGELRQLALTMVGRALAKQPHANDLLGLAATFQDVFPRALLLQMAEDEQLSTIENSLAYLIQHRFLLMGEAGRNLWMSPVLQAYIYRQQDAAVAQTRHRRAARYYRQQGEALRAARHLQLATLWNEAADLLLSAVDDLLEDLQVDELCQTLDKFESHHLELEQWREVQIWQSDLYARLGQQAEALNACRQALKSTANRQHQARIYRRMGKLYEKHNQLHALGYYQQAAERFAPGDQEFLELLKDRGWLFILRQEWQSAENDLTLALSHVGEDDALRADLYDALAALYRHQKRYDVAIQQAQLGLSLREQTGDLLRVAKSCNNLGLIYNDMGDYHHAIAAYEEAISTYRQLGNRGLIATSLSNIGMAHHLDGNLTMAVRFYNECLSICQQIGLPWLEIRAHSNLVEALAEMGQQEEALHHWQAGLALSVQAGFEDEVPYFRDLQTQFPLLQETTSSASVGAENALEYAGKAEVDDASAQETANGKLLPEEEVALAIAARDGKVTPKLLMAETDISKATATRRLAQLVDRALLVKHGEGRGTYYALPDRGRSPSAERLHVQENESGTEGQAALSLLDVERLRRLLLQQAPMLKTQFGVAALGWIEDPGQSEPHQAVVRFAVAPDIGQFFRLEYALGQLLDRALDLLPEESLQLRERELPILWLWEAKPSPDEDLPDVEQYQTQDGIPRG